MSFECECVFISWSISRHALALIVVFQLQFISQTGAFIAID